MCSIERALLDTSFVYLFIFIEGNAVSVMNSETGHPDATDLTRDYSSGNSDAMDKLTLGLGLGLGRVLGLELRRQDVLGLKNTAVSFLASGRSRQDVADPINSNYSTCSCMKSFT